MYSTHKSFSKVAKILGISRQRVEQIVIMAALLERRAVPLILRGEPGVLRIEKPLEDVFNINIPIQKLEKKYRATRKSIIEFFEILLSSVLQKYTGFKELSLKEEVVIAKEEASKILNLADEEVRNILQGARWKNGVWCPRCKSKKIHKYNTRYRGDCWLWYCRKCKRTFSDRTGTVFENNPIILRTWFAIIWFMVANPSIKQTAENLHIPRAIVRLACAKTAEVGYIL